MFKKLLVPLDGSELAEQALAPALTIARSAHGEVILFRVPVMETMLVSAPLPTGVGVLWPTQSLERSRSEAHNYLKALQDDYQQPDLTVRTHMAEGDVASQIVDTAQTAGVDLLVMSTHGYSGVTRWLLGSTAEKVLRSAPCPTLIVRNEAPLRRMLIPLDGSALAEQALPQALALAGVLNCQVVLLRVVAPVRVEVVEGVLVEPGLANRMQDDAYVEADKYLKRITETYARPGLILHAEVRTGPPADQILAFAEAAPSDVIAMATHGRTGLRRWVYGSVTEKVLRTAHGSMLVVRPPAQALK
jgi:nucleotide-binding universal stress UspA family protein